MAVTETAHLQPKQRRFLRFAIIAGVAVSLFAVIAGYVLYRAIEGLDHLSGFMYPSVATHEPDSLEAMLGFSLPENVSDIHNASYSFMQSRVIGIRFSLPTDDLDEFLAGLGFVEPLEADVNPTEHNNLFASEDWWQTEDTNTFVGGTFYDVGAQTIYDVFVDESNSAQNIVYLVVEQG
jgi:hypothetical protein